MLCITPAATLAPIALTDLKRHNKQETVVDATPPNSENKNDIGEPNSKADRHILAMFTAHAPYNKTNGNR